MTHYLKIASEYFDSFQTAGAGLTLQYSDDTAFVLGELVMVQEDSEPLDNEEYTGHEILAKVTYVSLHEEWMPKGAVMVGVRVLKGARE